MSDDSSYTVTQISNLIKNVLNENLGFLITVTGEVSNMKLSRTHLYATLKDEKASINLVYWNYTNYHDDNFMSNGQSVTIKGYVNTYPNGSRYQLAIKEITINGQGNLHLEYEKIKKKCLNKGYFDDVKKKPLPNNLNSVCVITAKHGAAVKDFLYVLKNLNYKGQVDIIDCRVQGVDCPKTVVECIKKYDQKYDCLVLTRGGGSTEDLFGFSHIDVVKAIYKAKTPIISAIGHEVDHMLSDFVADIRAPTPSVAGEVIGKSYQLKHNLQPISDFNTQLYADIINSLEAYKSQLQNCYLTLGNKEALVQSFIDKLQSYCDHLKYDIEKETYDYRSQLKFLEQKVSSCSPDNIMEQGFIVLTDGKKSITKIDDLLLFAKSDKNKKLKINLMDGFLTLKINSLRFFRKKHGSKDT